MPWIPVVSLSKGLEQGSLLRMTEVAKQELPGHPVGALTGPNIAREIIDGQAAAAVIATQDLDVMRVVADRVLVMDRGRTVESATPAQLLEKPEQPMTQRLVAAALPEISIVPVF